jgi:hypothetical protein
MRSPVWSAAFDGFSLLCQAGPTGLLELPDLLELAPLCAGVAFDGHDNPYA